MMTDNRMALVDLLVERTKASSVEWKMVESGRYSVNIGGSEVSITSEDRYDGGEEVDVVISIYRDGQLIESFSDVDLYNIDGEPWYPKMRELLFAAKRFALGTDKVIASIIDALKG